ncbi:SIS domain-containing protein [Deinococcus sp.]|uniref:SIS domain-containing protein n=1 Tax=Deinococcus sp. TaxID=47478 RepID=UPI0025B83E95|nr:SIS domain-containing protein [Deinococcus sp.]
MSATSDFLTRLEQLPGSYAGPTRTETSPYAVVGAGEGVLPADLFHTLIGVNLTRSGTQFVLSSADAADAARTYAELAEVAGATVRRVSTGGEAEDVDILMPGGALGAYHFAQYLAHATGHAEDAARADQLMADLASRCAPHVTENNPARDLAWSLWERVPLLLASPDGDALPQAWQHVLARVGKTLAIAVTGDPLPFVTGAFEAKHERGDGRVALILGDSDEALRIVAEILESRVDEVIHVPYPQGAEPGYAAQLSLWYFGVWVAAYLAERYGQTPTDAPVLGRAQAVLAGAETGDTLKAERDETRPRDPRDDSQDASQNEWADDAEDDDDDEDDLGIED